MKGASQLQPDQEPRAHLRVASFGWLRRSLERWFLLFATSHAATMPSKGLCRHRDRIHVFSVSRYVVVAPNSDCVCNFAIEYRALCRRLYVIHAHPLFPYSTKADQEKAHKFQAAIKARFADESGVKFGAIHPKALGPHPMPQFQVTFTKRHLVDVLPWLMFNRPEDFSILVHPFTAKPVITLAMGAS